MKKYIMATALAMILSASAFSSVQAQMPNAAANTPVPPSMAGSATSPQASCGIADGSLLKLLGLYFGKGTELAALDWQVYGFANANDMRRWLERAERIINERIRYIQNIRNFTRNNPDFERLYERLGFKTSKAMRKWYHFHIGHLVLGNKTYEACPDPAEEGGDVLTMAATNPQ